MLREDDLELAYINGRCVNAIAAKTLYELIADARSFESWQAEHIISLGHLARDVDWTVVDGRVLVSALSALMMMGAEEWNLSGWEQVAKSMRTRLAPRLEPDLVGFDEAGARRKVGKPACAECNVDAYGEAARKSAYERRRRELLWLRANGHPSR